MTYAYRVVGSRYTKFDNFFMFSVFFLLIYFLSRCFFSAIFFRHKIRFFFHYRSMYDVFIFLTDFNMKFVHVIVGVAVAESIIFFFCSSLFSVDFRFVFFGRWCFFFEHALDVFGTKKKLINEHEFHVNLSHKIIINLCTSNKSNAEKKHFHESCVIFSRFCFSLTGTRSVFGVVLVCNSLDSI